MCKKTPQDRINYESKFVKKSLIKIKNKYYSSTHGFRLDIDILYRLIYN